MGHYMCPTFFAGLGLMTRDTTGRNIVGTVGRIT